MYVDSVFLKVGVKIGYHHVNLFNFQILYSDEGEKKFNHDFYYY
jgi:hypothetical protein